MSRDSNKICVTFPSSILDMIIASLFHIFRQQSICRAYFWPFYGYIPNVKTFLFSNVRMKKLQFQVGKNVEEKIIVLSSKLCLKLFVYLFPFTFLPTIGISVVLLRCKSCRCIIRAQWCCAL